MAGGPLGALLPRIARNIAHLPIRIRGHVRRQPGPCRSRGGMVPGRGDARRRDRRAEHVQASGPSRRTTSFARVHHRAAAGRDGHRGAPAAARRRLALRLRRVQPAQGRLCARHGAGGGAPRGRSDRRGADRRRRRRAPAEADRGGRAVLVAGETVRAEPPGRSRRRGRGRVRAGRGYPRLGRVPARSGRGDDPARAGSGRCA